jgi:hypothetical protein
MKIGLVKTCDFLPVSQYQFNYRYHQKQAKQIAFFNPSKCYLPMPFSDKIVGPQTLNAIQLNGFNKRNL